MAHMGSKRSIIILENTAVKAARDIVYGVMRYASTRPEWKLEVLTGHPSELEEAVRIGRPDGIVSGFTDEPMNPIPVPIRHSTPTVFTCTIPPEGMKAPWSLLEMDNCKIAETASTLLLRKKLKSFGVFGLRHATPWSGKRLQTFRGAIQENGFTVSEFQISPSQPVSIEAEYADIVNWLTSLEKPCGIFAAADRRAKLLLDICQKEGINVPEQVKVVGVDNDEIVCECAKPTLSSIAPDFRRAGFEAAKTLDRLMRGLRTARRITIRNCSMVERMSTSDISGSGNRLGLALEALRRQAFNGGLTVGAIGASAFESCAGLVEVLLPETLTTIGNYAFEECASLKSVKPMFPASVVSFGARAFCSCSSLTGAVSLVGASLSLAQDTNYGTFQYTKINSIVITAPLVSTPRGMCANCSALEFAELPDTVTSLGENTFASSTALKRVRLSNNLTSIGMSAFWACSGLQEVKPFLPATVKGIGGTAFHNCTSLTNDLYLVSTNAVGFGKNNNQGTSGMFGGTKIGKLVITSPITGFGDSPVLFSGCKSLKYVEFPETLTTMRGDMFNSCSALSEMYFRGDRPDNLAPSLGSVSDYVLRIYVPKTGSGWDALPSGTVTAWNDLESSVQKQFSDRYSGKHPYALWNIATKKDIWLIYWNPKPTGMKIIFR